MTFFTWTGRACSDIQHPFGYDPGESSRYGTSIDWLGWVVEVASGMLLDKYVDKHILKLLSLRNTGLLPPDIAVHMRAANGSITATPYSVPAAKPGDFLAPGGNFLTSILDVYRMIRKQITRPTLVLPFQRPNPITLKKCRGSKARIRFQKYQEHYSKTIPTKTTKNIAHKARRC